MITLIFIFTYMIKFIRILLIIDVIYLLYITRQTGDGLMFHGVSMQGEFPFYFKKNGYLIQLIEKNVKFRSDDKSATSKALKKQITKSQEIIRKFKTGKSSEIAISVLLDNL